MQRIAADVHSGRLERIVFWTTDLFEQFRLHAAHLNPTEFGFFVSILPSSKSTRWLPIPAVLLHDKSILKLSPILLNCGSFVVSICFLYYSYSSNHLQCTWSKVLFTWAFLQMHCEPPILAPWTHFITSYLSGRPVFAYIHVLFYLSDTTFIYKWLPPKLAFSVSVYFICKASCLICTNG